MQQTVYIETTIVSYPAARPSRDLIVAAHQQVTRDWWDEQREKYRLLASPVVVAECAAGNPEQADARQRALAEAEVLESSSQIDALAERVAAALNIPDTKLRGSPEAQSAHCLCCRFRVRTVRSIRTETRF